MTTTKVKCKCISKAQKQNWSPENPVQHEIELQVPYDQKSIYYQLSGGTALKLMTINQAAADMFVIGGDYDLLISPSAD